MEKGQRVQIRIEDMTNEGAGLGRDKGLAVFVKGAVVGDVVNCEITKAKKNYALGKVVELIEPSPDRIEPECPYNGVCGGCQYGNISYEGQLRLKEKQVRDKLIRLAGLENPTVNPIMGMEDPYRYRNKATMPVWTGGIITRKGGVVENLGEPAIGFYRGKSHDVVDCYDCLLQSEPAMAAAEALRQFMESDNITAYDPKWDKGLMRHLIVKTAKGTGEVMVILVVNGKGIPNASKLIEMLDDFIYSLHPAEDGVEYSLESVVLNVNKTGKELLTDEFITLAGKPNILEEVGGLKFEISPRAFYQVNPVQMEKLYGKAMEYADFQGGETVLDLYCGVGTIGLFAIAAGAERVLGIETVKGAVIDANRNAVINGIVNARYVCGKAEEELPKVISGEDLKDETLKIDRADVVFLDPPRAGCDERLLDSVAEVGPEKIVYISCDPATLARDIKYLGEKGYAFEEATPVDMFPWTGHVEVVTCLQRVNS
ncbi:MAG: 23S rRNA (uracil(1939)-C(5))-methyltransferase RlmD [Eubacteriaceae bacterium]|nr:23S rRNA (uracil(1939)-C(5))-methyltransferase RlmD [Eubacteriaceae bacterium]